LLKARKEFDTWMLSGKGPKIFDPALENAMSLALREIRQTTNNFISTRAPTVGVRRSLDKQFKLLRAMDDIKVKAADEGNNAVSRLFKSALKILPLRGEFNQMAAILFGVGGLGASAAFAPYFTKLVGAGVASYILGKAILKPGARKALGQLLKSADMAIKRTTDPALLRQLRADRAAVVELLKTSDDKEETQ
jgi:hypothetical protein